jgi:hypothetical protein
MSHAPHSPEQLLVTLGATAAGVATLVEGFTPDDLGWRPLGTGWNVHGHHVEWSLVQHICHLRDLEVEGYGARIPRFGRETDPFFADVDGDRLAAERDYGREDAAGALAAFGAARARSLETARDLLGSGRMSSGRLEGVGRVTLEDLLGFMRNHDAGHLEAMQRLRDHIRERRRSP